MKALVVDGYNLIFSHPRLGPLMREDQEAARSGLLKELAPLATPEYFQPLAVVFDAAASTHVREAESESGGMTVVFTRRGQSADSFIEALVRRMLGEGEVTVATSDRLLRDLVSGFGARTLGGEALLALAGEALGRTREDMRRMASGRRPLEDRLSDEMRRLLDEMRYA